MSFPTENHAQDDPTQQEENDEIATINRLLGGEQVDALEDIQNRELDRGEKADDAEDYEDIDDDDLIDEDDDKRQQLQDATMDTEGAPVNGESGDQGNINFDELFGADDDQDDGRFNDLFNEPETSTQDPNQIIDAPTSPLDGEKPDTPAHKRALSVDSTAEVQLSPEKDKQDSDDVGDDDIDLDDPRVQEQMQLFAQAKQTYEQRMQPGEGLPDAAPPPAPETDAEVFSAVWPQFEEGKPPRWNQLIKQKYAHYLGKTPPKPPRPLHLAKVNLDIEPDQEKLFKLPGAHKNDLGTRQADAASKGFVLTVDDKVNMQNEEEDEDVEMSDGTSDVGGLNWNDFVNVCTDWNIPEAPPTPPPDTFDILVENDDEIAIEAPKKKHKTVNGSVNLFPRHYDSQMSWDDPFKATARLAKQGISLDMNDPYLLLEVQDPSVVIQRKRKLNEGFKRDQPGDFTRFLHQKYNISNDEDYEKLKENHHTKVRSNINMIQSIEHALPAERLQYPFYKVRLSAREARSFHRPPLHPENGVIYIDRMRHIKRKHLKGKGGRALFETTSDLSQADNSNVLLLEHSEEYPAMLPSFGMGSRLINWYRRVDDNDNSRPKQEIGETSVLMPQDRSPFSIFGDVGPGKVVPTIQNSLYRAPVFKHGNRTNDFLLISNRTGENGRRWFLKNIENLHVVGQQFPNLEVPGPHSRKVTDASKKRLKMLSYRIHNKKGILKNETILRHLPGTDIAQNRSKMREIMNYDKDKGWYPKERPENVPDENAIRAWLKPEEICLLDSMQVGDRQLQDAGYNKDNDDFENEDDDKEGQSLDQHLAPWQTTKNFLQACQGKAMLQLYGEGDPSGRGEAFNLIKTSMKGGFKEIGESVQDRLDYRRRQDLGGHSYNVAKQQKAYQDAIRRIWEKQATSLSSGENHDVDIDDAQEDMESPAVSRGRTPSAALGASRRDDETTSVFSRTSVGSQTGKFLKIYRKYRNQYGQWTEDNEIIRNPLVIREYQKRRRQRELQNLRYVPNIFPRLFLNFSANVHSSINDMRWTGNAELDQLQKEKLEAEIARIKRTGDRKLARERAKGTVAASPGSNAGSPAATGAAEGGEDVATPSGVGARGGRRGQTGGTQRKCANCGQTGHIKTNKKCVNCQTGDGIQWHSFPSL